MVIYVIQKNGGNKNFLDSLKVMVNYHYHSENSVITWQFPSMRYSGQRGQVRGRPDRRGGIFSAIFERTDIDRFKKRGRPSRHS